MGQALMAACSGAALGDAAALYAAQSNPTYNVIGSLRPRP